MKLKLARSHKKTELSDFSFLPSGYGHYKVTYQSPNTGKKWQYTTSNMPLIDATKNAETPLRKDLDALKYHVKSNGFLLPSTVRTY